MSRGIVYVATGEYYIKRMAISVATLRRDYVGPVMMLTDKPAKYFAACAKKYKITVKVQPTGESHAGLSSRVLKTQVAKLCPYETALFLDVDTLILRSIRSIWGHLKPGKPLAMTVSDYHPKIKDAASARHMRSAAYVKDLRATEKLAGPNFPHYCSSTMLWERTPQLLQMFEAWWEEWNSVRGPDMFALARALCRTKLPVLLLPRRFSVRKTIRPDTVVYTPRIIKLVSECRKHCPQISKAVKADFQHWG